MKALITRILILYFAVSTLVFTLSTQAIAQTKKPVKGLLPQLQTQSNSESENQKKMLQSEVLIAESENKAIQALEKILIKKKGSPEEADLNFRLAELYMRKAKSGRFFDLIRNDANTFQYAPSIVKNEGAKQSLRKATQIYFKIETQFPKYSDMDQVYFNNGFAHQQLGLNNVAAEQYQTLISRFKSSQYLPDSHIALGEIRYDQQQYSEAYNYFNYVEGKENLRVYSYGMYKSAWSLYNMKKTPEAMERLKVVVQKNAANSVGVALSLRQEALRDLGIFFTDTQNAKDAYSYFKEITTPAEFAEVMTNIAKIYQSHSKFNEQIAVIRNFTQNEDNSPITPKLLMAVADSLNVTKKRPEAIKELTKANELCSLKSTWRKKNNTPEAQESCEKEVRNGTLEMAKAWWELWQKNPTINEVADWTAAAFKAVIENENPQAPDIKTHYAYAELLFQKKDYKAAADNYKITYSLSEKDPAQVKLNEDALYAHIVSTEKYQDALADKEQNTRLNTEVKTASLLLLEKYPKSTNAIDLKLKVGVINYELGLHDEAIKFLTPLAQQNQQKSVAEKAQDILLDTYNLKKDFAKIVELSTQVLATKPSDERRKKIAQIQVETEFAIIIEKKEPLVQAEEFIKFRKKYPNTELAQKALWQAMSLHFTHKSNWRAAELAQQYANEYPTDKKSIEGLSEAMRVYADMGFFDRSLGVLQVLLKHKLLTDSKERNRLEKLIPEYLFLEEDLAGIEEWMKNTPLDATQKNDYRMRLLVLAERHGQKEKVQALSASFVKDRIDPYFTRDLVQKLQADYEAKRYAKVFDEATRIINGKGPAEERAKAKILQAKILEQEFSSQSLKAKPERLNLVLSMKAEKLEKAQTAYLSAEKLTPTVEGQLEANMGLLRLYSHYVEAMTNLPLLKELSPEEAAAVQEELKSIIDPVALKKEDINKRIATLNASSSTVALQLDPASTIDPKTNWQNLIETKVSVDGKILKHKEYSDKDCKLDTKNLVEAINACLQVGNSGNLQKLILTNAMQSAPTVDSLILHSFAALQKKNYEKALVTTELAIKKHKEVSPLLVWLKASAQLGMGDIVNGKKLLGELKNSSEELSVMGALVEFESGNCAYLSIANDKLGKAKLAQVEAQTVIADCVAKEGKIGQALEIMNKYLTENGKVLDNKATAAWLEKARIHEKFEQNVKQSIASYEMTLKGTFENEEIRKWIENKIKFLKSNSQTNNTLHVTSK